MTEFLITWSLMAVVVSGGLFMAVTHGALHRGATEPFLSYQTIDFGVALALSAGVPLWRGHTITGWIVLALGVFLTLRGILDVRHYHRGSAECASSLPGAD